MLIVAGFIIVLLAVFGGFVLQDGHLAALFQQHRDHGENRAVHPQVVEDEARSGRGQRAAAEHEQEQVAGQRLGPGKGQRGD